MDKAPHRYFVDVAGFKFEVEHISGVEHIAKPFRFDLEFPVRDRNGADPLSFDPDNVIKRDAVITIVDDDGPVRSIKGVVTEVDVNATVTGIPMASLVIEPRFAILRFRQDIRIHRNQTVPEIVRDVVEALGVTIEWRLRETYESRPYCVQWRESDFDYVNRLLEDEGIFYFFTADDVMILGDSPAAYDEMPGARHIPYRQAAGLDRSEEAVVRVGTKSRVTPGKVTLRDWNTEHPSLNMDVSHPAPLDNGPEWYDYPGEYDEPAGGARKARLHGEMWTVAHAATVGRTTVPRMYPGATYLLEDAPVGVVGGEHVITHVTHEWRRDKDSFDLGFESLDGPPTFRPPRETYVPRILNPHTGIVCTPPGEDIHCDHFGRVKVHFHWDRLRPYDDDCSHWIPVAQDNTGHSMGIPRVNWEVMVHFAEGDPDRPIVLGRVYNADDPFTEKLPMMKTRSGLKSMSSPARDDTNEIRFDDAQGAEMVFMHASKDQNINIANDKSEIVDNTEGTVVRNNETIAIGNDDTRVIDDSQTLTVEKNQSWSVGGNRKRKVGGAETGNVEGDHTLAIGGNHKLKVDFDAGMSAKNLTETIGGMVLEKFQAGHYYEAASDMNLTVGGALIEVAGNNRQEGTNIARVETIGGLIFTKAQAEVKHRVDKTRICAVGVSNMAKSTKLMTLAGGDKFSATTPSFKFDGTQDLTLRVGQSSIIFKDGKVTIKAPKTISMLVSGMNEQGSGKANQI